MRRCRRQGRLFPDPLPANTKSGTITRRLDARASAPQAAPSAGKAEKGDAAKEAAPKTPADQSRRTASETQEREKGDKEAAEKAAEAKRKEDNCRVARERLAQLDIGRIARVNRRASATTWTTRRSNSKRPPRGPT